MKDPALITKARSIYIIYIVLTVLEFILLLAGGMPLFESAVHALGTAGTGGFGVYANSMASYSPYIQWVVTIFRAISSAVRFR